MPYNFKKIQDIEGGVGKHVLLRIDTNVALKDGRVLEDFRLKKVFPTIDLLRQKGMKIVLIGHLESEETHSLEAIYVYLKNYFPLEFVQSATVVDDAVRAKVAAMKDGDIILLENLRLNEGEKKNSPEFAKQLADLADIYVDDAFSVAHRAHASVVGVPALIPGYAGMLFTEEVTNLSKCFDPAKPFLFMLGGAKFETKLPLVKKFLQIADTVFICGALANDCFKQKGLNVGVSVVSEKQFDLNDIVKDPKTLLPSDVVVKNGEEVSVKLPEAVFDQDKILDAGPKTLDDLSKLIDRAKFILWNGPLGQYEAGFTGPTEKLARMIAGRTAQGGITSVLGGGDTLAVISRLNIENKFSFVSGAGGAMLEFLADETLAGIEALEKSKA